MKLRTDLVKFNSTDNIKLYGWNRFNAEGVILPHSNGVLTDKEIDKKINKMTSHIKHLETRMSSGHGKRARARKTSLTKQMQTAKQRLATLHEAKKAYEIYVIPETTAAAYSKAGFTNTPEERSMLQLFRRIFSS